MHGTNSRAESAASRINKMRLKKMRIEKVTKENSIPE
jgi:hypothetical protein